MEFQRSILSASSHRYGYPSGTTGRGKALTPKAICISYAGLSAPEYLTYVQAQLPVKTLQRRLGMPHSVHYLVRADGAIYRIIPEHDAAWGVMALVEPQWTSMPPESVYVDESLLHIAFEGRAVTSNGEQSAVELAAWLAKKWHIPADADHIIARALLDAESPMQDLPQGFVARVYSHLSLQPEDVTSVTQLVARIKSLELRVAALEPQGAK